MDRFAFAVERIKAEHHKCVKCFQPRSGHWVLVNETLPAIKDFRRGVDVPVEGSVALTYEAKLLLASGHGGRLIQAPLVEGA